MQDISKEVSLGNIKLVFQKFGIEIILVKSLQYLFDMPDICSQVIGVDQDIIKVYNISNI